MEQLLKQQVAESQGVIFPQTSTMTDRLRARRDMLRQQLDDVEQALSALESNEEVARVVDAISRLGHF